NPEEFTSVSSGKSPGRHDLFVLGNNFLDDKPQIGKTRDQRRNLSFVRRWSPGRSRDVRSNEPVALGNQLIDEIELPFVPRFLVEAPNDFLGRDGHERNLLRNRCQSGVRVAAGKTRIREAYSER